MRLLALGTIGLYSIFLRQQKKYRKELSQKAQLEKTGLADKVVIGEENDFFAVVKKYKPDIILLGYDQRLPPHVEEKLKKYSKKITIIKAKRHGSYRSGNT